MLQHTCKFSHVPQFTVNIFFFLIVSNSGYFHHLGLFSCNGFHMFLRRYPSYQKKQNKQKKKQLTKTETFWFALMTSWKTSKFQKLPPAVTVSCRDGREVAKNDWLLWLTNEDEWEIWSRRAVNSVAGNLSLDENKVRRLERECVVMMNPGEKRRRTKISMSGCLLGSYFILWTHCP